MNRAASLVGTLVAFALGACSEQPASDGAATHAGSAAGGANAGANASGGNPPLAGAAGTESGGAGTTASGGVNQGGVAGSGASGSGGATGGSAGSAGSAGNAGACAPPAVICDDFEKYPVNATDLGPDWIAYTYSGAVKVDATKPHAGKQSLHLTTQAGMRHYADIIRETRGQRLLPQNHYGRLHVFLSSLPPASHFNLNLSSGPLLGFPDEIGKFAEGGMFGKLMSNYAQRERAMANGQYLLRGGGPEQGDAAADADCAVAAPSQTISAGKWVCWEWQFDGTKDEAHLWLDDMPMSEVDALQNGKQCQGPGFNGKPMTATYRWESPQLFDKLIIGYEQYQDTPAQEVWIDDLAVGTARIGCAP